MALANVFNRIGQLGVGLAVAGGVVQSALYNVDGGYRAVMFDRFRGILPNVTGKKSDEIVFQIKYILLHMYRYLQIIIEYFSSFLWNVIFKVDTFFQFKERNRKFYFRIQSTYVTRVFSNAHFCFITS